MNNTNNYKGIKKIIIGESIDIISIIISQILSLLLTIYLRTLSSDDVTALAKTIDISADLVIVISFILSLISTIISITFTVWGVAQSIRYDNKFKEALVVIIIKSILSVVGIVTPDLSDIFDIVSLLADLWFITVIMQGIININDNNNNKTIANKGLRAMKNVLLLYSLGVLTKISYSYIILNMSQLYIGLTLLIISMALETASYIIYLRYLIIANRQLMHLKV